MHIQSAHCHRLCQAADRMALASKFIQIASVSTATGANCCWLRLQAMLAVCTAQEVDTVRIIRFVHNVHLVLKSLPA